MPMRAGTGEQSVFEHVDCRAELLPEGGPPQWIHVYSSRCHADPNFKQYSTHVLFCTFKRSSRHNPTHVFVSVNLKHSSKLFLACPDKRSTPPADRASMCIPIKCPGVQYQP